MLYPIYKTDVHHSYASRDLIGIATTIDNAIKIIKKQAKKESCRLSIDDLYNLTHIDQTQNYKGTGEFVIDKINENVLL